jgi:recombination protein RecR
VLAALDGVRPEDLRIASLLERAGKGGVREVIIALSATVDGQTTAHYLTERLKPLGVQVSRLSHGVPVGGELELLDDGTLFAALASRRPFSLARAPGAAPASVHFGQRQPYGLMKLSK